ncbi:selenocysteine-specific translation elongation factor [Nesterenkonia aerolata]|uniref:Selenocysteine-specific elongation factor n=1 Tax=Nesterenkonia aerolata TaxID=3074079 RepID=A0ABU2DSX5_9MICC|nr:selenocysteine-specific translation elongation factor [Nesterenkonia sp. LY-0111]MDR8019470.1 selenocysteine-specific translation elongation factor [Nesterenkonia sp. LY-0111]
MTRLVVATAGHVDHGKSALVRALTGIEPDRWEEEHRRGLTIDLGFAWTHLPSGGEVAFVDVPGHERFLSNALAGLAAAPAVCFVVAADKGWQRQSDDHRDAVAALGISAGVIVITRSDLAPERVAAVAARARRELAGTALVQVPVVVTSARTGEGLGQLRGQLDTLRQSLSDPSPGAEHAPVRLWVDRSFTIPGAGTVVTGTLTEGRIRRGDRLLIAGGEDGSPVEVRGLRRHDRDATQVEPFSRVALNLRGVSTEEVRRGDALLSPQRWHQGDTVDVLRTSGLSLQEAGEHLVCHIGTAAVEVRVRALSPDHARLRLDRRLAVRLDDAAVLVDPGGRGVRAGVRLLDVDPPELLRRGDAARRAAELAGRGLGGDCAAEVRRRGAVPVETLRRFGLAEAAAGAVLSPRTAVAVRRIGGLFVDEQALGGWAQTLREAVAEAETRDQLTAGMTRGAALDLLRLPEAARAEPTVLDAVVSAADLRQEAGRLRLSVRNDLGAAEVSLRILEDRLRQHPFRAPEADDLQELGLGRQELAAAESLGRILRLDGHVVLLPSAPAQAMRRLSRWEGAFTASQARELLGTTRRVAIPLLEHLDSRGWTRRLDGSRRIVVQ